VIAIAWPNSTLLIVTAVRLVWIRILGMIWARDVIESLHRSGATVLVGAPPLAVAVSITNDWSTSLRAWLITAVLVPTNIVLAHATACAEWLRRHCESEGRDGEEAGEDAKR
jgi:multisubunit Na+/H+ antiporter MnhG subunit